MQSLHIVIEFIKLILDTEWATLRVLKSPIFIRWKKNEGGGGALIFKTITADNWLCGSIIKKSVDTDKTRDKSW